LCTQAQVLIFRVFMSCGCFAGKKSQKAVGDH